MSLRIVSSLSNIILGIFLHVGLIYDTFGEYSIAFFVSGGLSTLGVAIMFLVPLLLDSRQQQSSCPKRREVSVLQEHDKPAENVLSELSM